MLTQRKSQHIQRVLLLATAALALYYIGIYRPLARRVAALDRPLADNWRALNRAHVGGHAEASGVEMTQIEALLWQAQRLASNWVAVSNLVLHRIEPPPAIRTRLNAPFQLVTYENDRQLRLEQLQRLANEQKIALAPGVSNWFPEFSADLKQPALLWAQLWFADELVRAALACKPTELRALSATQASQRSTNDIPAAWADDIHLRIETVGTVEAAATLLRCLPLRPLEIKTAGLPATSPNKPAFFLDRLLVRRQIGEPADLVHLDLRLRGYVRRESTNAPAIAPPPAEPPA